VNKKNQFNTPFGRYKNPKISDEDLIKNVSKFLRKIKIFSMDFENFLIQNAKKGDFIYLDPPYHPISKYSDFKRYTKDFFEFKDQQRLAELFNTLDSRGCKLLLSNSFADSILKLYSNFETITVFSSRSINSNPDGRGLIKEVLIRNYE
jgi:DNA adenine methylase